MFGIIYTSDGTQEIVSTYLSKQAALADFPKIVFEKLSDILGFSDRDEVNETLNSYLNSHDADFDTTNGHFWLVSVKYGELMVNVVDMPLPKIYNGNILTKLNYTNNPVAKAYEILETVFNKKEEPTLEETTFALEEALGYLGEALDD